MTKNQCRKALVAGSWVTSLATLLRVTVEDARGLNRFYYEPRWDKWHAFTPDTRVYDLGKCSVCTAGALIVGTLGVVRDVFSRPGHFPYATESALMAIDSIRQGNLVRAYAHLMLFQNHPDVLRNGVVDKLQAIEKRFAPADRQFESWEQFERHLDSLDVLANRLEKFEEKLFT